MGKLLIGYRLNKRRTVQEFTSVTDRNIRLEELERDGYEIKIFNNDEEANKYLDLDSPPPRPLTVQDRWYNWALGRPLNWRP